MNDKGIAGVPVKPLDIIAADHAELRQGQLTKPPGSLGRLEHVVIALASMQGRDRPSLDKINTVVFAADHGIAEEGVSAFPQSVTVEMIRNFSTGGAAICVLSKASGSRLEVVDVGAVKDVGKRAGVVSARVAAGTANFCKTAAMTESELDAALDVGKQAVQRGLATDLFIGGEMGIANTTSATALACALLQVSPSELTGPGTGLDAKGVAHKVQVIEAALVLHEANIHEPKQVLRCLGGLEIAALVGAYIHCAQAGIPILLDGYISGVAALLAQQMKPGVRRWMIQSHASAEPGHVAVLAALELKPLLELQMRLGEASGAAVAVPLLRSACALHAGMATFAEAAVSAKSQ